MLCLGQECIGLVLPKRTAVRLMKTSDITAATSSRPSNSQQTCSCCRYHVKFPHPPWHHYLFSRGSTTPVVKSLPAKSQQKRLSFCLACRPLRHPRPDFFLSEPSVRRKGIQLCNVTPVKNSSPWCGEWRNIRSIKKKRWTQWNARITRSDGRPRRKVQELVLLGSGSDMINARRDIFVRLVVTVAVEEENRVIYAEFWQKVTRAEGNVSVNCQ